MHLDLPRHHIGPASAFQRPQRCPAAGWADREAARHASAALSTVRRAALRTRGEAARACCIDAHALSAAPGSLNVCDADTIYDVLRARGFKEVDSETDWDVAWVETAWLRENFDGQHLEDHQRINHFRNHYVRVPRSHVTDQCVAARIDCTPLTGWVCVLVSRAGADAQG